MKLSPGFRMVGLLLLGWMVAGTPVSAQSNLVLTVSTPTYSVPVGSPFTYTTFVTNETISATQPLFVTNALSASVQIVGTNTTRGLILEVNGNIVTFSLEQLSGRDSAEMTVTVNPTTAGFITNTVTLFIRGVESNVVLTVVQVNQVTNSTTPTQADLAVTITGPAQAVITNDYMTYGVTVSNLGPDSASGVFLTNTYSANVILISISPTNVPAAITNDMLLLTLGTLGKGVVTNVYLRLQPTNAGPLTFTASVGASTPDANTTNNIASTNLFVTNYLSGQLAVSFVDSAQHFNPQDGLMEQTIQLANVGTSAVASARVVVSGLTGTNWLFNASGTNDGNPFVVYAATLNPTQSVNLLLQYLVPTGEPFDITTNQLPAYEVPSVVWTPPANPGTPVQITRELQLSWGDTLIEFQSITGRCYTVVYSDDQFTNAMLAPPSIAAPGDRMQWIDYGPPTTISHPVDTNSRSYRVYLNP